MRKHFLLLFLMALLPLAGWADVATQPTVATAPTAVPNLVYTKAPKTLVSGGTASDGASLFYAVVAHDDAAPVWAATNNPYSATVPSKTEAGDYDVYVIAVNSTDNTKRSAATIVEASIAKAVLNITPTAYGEKVYGATDYAALTDFYTISNAAGGSGGFYEGDNATSEGLAVTGTITSWTKDHAVSVEFQDSSLAGKSAVCSAEFVFHYFSS